MAAAGASTDYHAITHATPCDGDFFVCTWLPAAQQPSRRSSRRLCCYGSWPCARARYLRTAAAAPPRTPSGSYAARRSAAAETPLPLVSHPAIQPGASYASGICNAITPQYLHDFRKSRSVFSLTHPVYSLFALPFVLHPVVLLPLPLYPVA